MDAANGSALQNQPPQAEATALQTLWQRYKDAKNDALRQRYQDQLLKRLEPLILIRARFACRHHPAVNPDEVAQDARFAVWQCLNRYDPDRALFLIYASGVIDGAVQASISDSYEDQLTGDTSEAYDPIAAATDRIALEQAIDNLTARHRDVITLRYWMHLSQKEVAELLDISRRRVGQIEAGALKTLKYWLTKED